MAWGMGDVMREQQEQLHELDDMVTDLKQELKEKNNYIVSLEYACSYILDWYWNIEEPGYVPDSLELRTNLKYINRILKNRRSDDNDIKGDR
jgi:hypothetical protein